MSVLIGVVGYNLSLASGRQAEECARKLGSVLSQARTTTMGKYRNDITVAKSEDGVTVKEVILIRKEGDDEVTSDRFSIVGDKSVTVEYKYTGIEYTELKEGGINLNFSSGTGALTVPTSENQLIFRISKAGKERFVIINCLTGKVSVGSSEDAASTSSKSSTS
jgi:hypothetical protein